MTYPEAMVVGFIQGVTELFPVSSLGHSVLIPALIGGSWANDLSVSKATSPYLAFVVGLHVATALGIAAYFWRDWVRIIKAWLVSIVHGQVRTTDERLAWMLVFATIPVGIVGLAFEHEFRVLFGKPVRAAIFLVINGVILYAGERFRTRKSLQADAELERQRAAQATGAVRAAVSPQPQVAAAAAAAGPASPAPVATAPTTGGAVPRTGARHAAARPGGTGQLAGRRQEEVAGAVQADLRLSELGYWQAVIIGSAQVLALLAGISRDGVTMVTGMFRGLSREDAARFAFLLATPVILAAGVLKLPDLTGPLGDGIHGQILVGSLLSGIGAYISVRFLMRYFQTRTLTPFAVYCVLFGVFCIVYLQLT